MPVLSAVCAALLLLVAPAATAQAEGTAGDSLAKQAERAPKRGFLWEARKGGHKAYLLGTLHVGRADFFPPNIEYLRRFQEATAIVVEADVFDAAHVAKVVNKMALYREGEPGLDSRLNDGLKARLAAQLRRFALDADRAWRMKPWMLANTLVILQATRSGFNPAYATESFLYQFAVSTGKPLLEIESIEMQLSIFERASFDTQVAYLEQALRGVESGESEREVRRIVEAWEQRDTAAAESLAAEIHKGTEPGERFVAQQMFDARHPAMVEAIERYVASGKVYLIAVGALHYFGPSGLLAMLRGRGYTVTLVP